VITADGADHAADQHIGEKGMNLRQGVERLLVRSQHDQKIGIRPGCKRNTTDADLENCYNGQALGIRQDGWRDDFVRSKRLSGINEATVSYFQRPTYEARMRPTFLRTS
jgi:hypothetical protein